MNAARRWAASPVGRVVQRWWTRVLAVLLLVVAIERAGPTNVWASLLAADGWRVTISVALGAPFILLRALRWRVVLADLGIRVPLSLSARLYTIGLYVGTITPGQAGDAIKAWYLRGRGESLALGLLSCVLDRLFDILILAALATTALVVYWPAERLQFVIGFAIVLGVFVGLVLLARPALRTLLMGLPGPRLVWRPVERRVRRLTWGPALLESGLGTPAMIWSVLLTFAGFAVTMTRVYLLFEAVDIHLDVLRFVAVASVAVFASLVSVGGVGSRDLALIALLTPFGYSQQQAVAASFLILFISYATIVPGFFLWLGQNDRPTVRADDAAGDAVALAGVDGR